VDRNLESAEIGMGPSNNEYITEQVEHENTEDTTQQPPDELTESVAQPPSPARAHVPTASE
jgi:hypothetical protein